MAKSKMICAKCGTEMNHHANKIDYLVAYDDSDDDESVFDGVLQEAHTCPNCGRTELRRA